MQVTELFLTIGVGAFLTLDLNRVIRKEASVSEESGQSNQNKADQKASDKKNQKVQEKSLERMEALLKQSAMGIHILFDNQSIADVMKQGKDDKDFFDFNKMKRVQDVMTELIAKKTYVEKVSFVRDLDDEAFEMLVRTYFHIVENTVRASSDHPH